MTLLCTLAQVRKMIGLSDGDDTGDDTLIDNVLIPAASAMIENDVQFTFGTLQSSLTLFTRPPYLVNGVLYFRDNVITAIDSFNVDTGTLTENTDYVLLPLNSTPKTRAQLLAWDSTNVTNTAGTLTITGTLGYGSIPSDVNFVATKLAAWMYQTRDSAGEIQVINDITVVPAEAPPMVKIILSKYRHNLIFA